MAVANRDDNSIPTMIGVLNTDGATPTKVRIDATTHALHMSDGVSGSDLGQNNAERDDNMIPVMLAVSEVDGSTPVPLYVNSSGQLLVDST